jgi:hypothetical protein
VADPERSGALLRKVYQMVGGGALPVPEHTSYPMSETTAAIRATSGAQHTGKLVLTVPRGDRVPVVMPPAQVPVFPPTGPTSSPAG